MSVPAGTHGPPCACDRCRVAYAMHYRFEWQGVPPDVAATGLYTRGLRSVMETPPEYQRTTWTPNHSKRYTKTVTW